jgi:hypothetical protein
VRTAEYERLVLEGLHRILIEPGSQAANLARRGETHGGVRVERVYLDESGPEHEIAILFRDLDRPECPFGYTIEAVETALTPTPTSRRRRRCGRRSCESSSKKRSLPSAAGYPAAVPSRPSFGYKDVLACLPPLGK